MIFEYECLQLHNSCKHFIINIYFKLANIVIKRYNFIYIITIDVFL